MISVNASVSGFVAAAVLFAGGRATATTFTVTSTSDTHEGVCGDVCTVRDAIAAATRAVGPDIVTLPVGTYVLTRSASPADDPGTGDLDIYDDLTIAGAGRDRTVVDAASIDRIFEVHDGAALHLSGVTLRNGSALSGGGVRVQASATLSLEDCLLSANVSGEHGGAVYNDGITGARNCAISGNSALGFGSGGGIYNSNSAMLALDNTTVTENSARNGAGVYNEGTVTLTDCTLSHGAARDIGVGGALFNLGTAALTNCTLNDNAAFGGAGVFNRAGATVTLESCTLSANIVSGFGRGGGLYNRGTAAVRNCTFWGNAAAGGANLFGRGTTTLANTIVANGLVGPSCAGSVTSAGYNLDVDDECGLTAAGDLSGAAAELTPLGDYGGPTRTHALCRGPSTPHAQCSHVSIAIDMGDEANCPPADQRGAPRPSGAACDIGAFESGAQLPAVCSGDCGSDGAVTVDDLVRAIEIALGAAPLATCVQVDANADALVTVEEIVLATTSALHGCPGTFVEFPWQATAPDVRAQRLCAEAADPDHAADTTFIDCAIEGATFAPPQGDAGGQIHVLAYNILRGFEVDAQLAEIRSGGHFPVPDVLLLSEVDRGCRRTQFRNIARDYAEALGYYYVYTTEFVELPGSRGDTGPYDPPLCEHGNAIVARYPLGNVRQIRHARNLSWYTPPDFPNPDEPRLGGRIALAADMKVGDRLVRLYSLHLESTLSALRMRDAQAVEIAEEAVAVEYPVIAGGDLNAYFAVLDFMNGSTRDGPTQAFLTRGFADAHAALPLDGRTTTYDPVPLIIDFIYVRNAAVGAAGVCEPAVCGALSDHLPVWATVALEE